jgi:hypothetical protein
MKSLKTLYYDTFDFIEDVYLSIKQNNNAKISILSLNS